MKNQTTLGAAKIFSDWTEFYKCCDDLVVIFLELESWMRDTTIKDILDFSGLVSKSPIHVLKLNQHGKNNQRKFGEYSL